MENNKIIIRIRNFMKEKPVTGTLITVFLYFILSNLIGLAMYAMPDKTYVYYLQEFLFMGCALLFVLILGYGWIYREGGFFRTLKAVLPVFLAQGFFAVGTVLAAILDPETQWKSPAMIGAGIIALFEIGFCEESIFRGIAANVIGKKYCRDRKGVWMAAIITGAMFGIVHVTNVIYGVTIEAAIIQVIMATAIGVFFAAVYFRGGNIWALILVHALTDTNSLFEGKFTEISSDIESINGLSLASLIMFPVFIGMAAFLLRKKKISGIVEKFRE